MTNIVLARIDASRLRSLVLVAALAGLLAGLVGATFARVAGEPSIRSAIAIEEANAAANPEPTGHVAHNEEEATVSRADQQGAGLFGAYALAGAAFGALLALTAWGLRRGSPDPLRRTIIAGCMLAGAFTVAPWLKYPPNPPAVGDPGTLGDRQWLYVAVIGLALLVGIATVMFSRWLRERGWSDHRRVPALVAFVAIPMLLAYGLMPPPPDAVGVPATLVWRFRLASLGANLTMWAALTLLVGFIVTEAANRRAAGSGLATASDG